MKLMWALILIMSIVFIINSHLIASDISSPYRMVDGKFGYTFKTSKDAWQWIAVKPNKEYFQRPITIEFWVNLQSGGFNNVVLSAGTRNCPGHWDLYVTRWSIGDLGFYMPDYHPSYANSPRKLDFGNWYYAAAVIQENHMSLYMNGEEVYSSELKKINEFKLPEILTDDFHLFFGTDTVQNSSALIDEVRISKGVQDVSVVPNEPFKADAKTIGLWHFDEDKGGLFKDESSNGNDAYLYTPEKVSLNELDRRAFNPKSTPLEFDFEQVTLSQNTHDHSTRPLEICLDGTWEMAEAGSEEFRIKQPWPDSFDARVPGSIHQALFEAGRIPDPRVGKNIEIACQKSFSPHYFKKTFTRPKGEGPFKLIFDGVCGRYEAWLNGELLGDHVGKYIRKEFDITDHLEDENILIVRIDPAKHQWHYGEYISFYDPEDIDIPSTQGWHYARLAVRGIWKSVKIKRVPVVQVKHPFITTEDAQKGLVHLMADVEAHNTKISGNLIATITPDNFVGKSYTFTQKVTSGSGNTFVHYRFQIPDPQLWWPVDYGKQNLYRLKLSFLPDDGSEGDYKEAVFGIRTIENKPLPGGPYPNRYNWRFVINGREVFLKGANWCWTEAFLEFHEDRYERFISLARDQHLQVLRAWGAGIYEFKEFYEACDRKGVMVLQELISGPYDLWDQTVEQFIYDMRNHPSLIWYGGGNEVDLPYGHFNKIGRMTYELDGTRPFHRTDPWGGSEHDYGVFWGKSPFEHNLDVVRETTLIGEFGYTSMPNIESVRKYVPEDEIDIWPYDPNGSYAYHTPAYNRKAGYGNDMVHVDHYAVDFCKMQNMQEHIIASQLAQTTALRPTGELARCLWPKSAGMMYYKLTNCVPAASYDVIDWYGVPKITHYFMQDAYAPLHGCVIFEKFNPVGEEIKAQVYILDDIDALNDTNWNLVVKAYDSNLKLIKRQSYKGKDSIAKVKPVGEFVLSSEQTQSNPLLITAKTVLNEKVVDHTFYWLNYKAKPGCLFELPKTKLNVKVVSRGTEPEEGLPYAVKIINKGKKPAVGVHFDCPEISDTFRARDSYFWLDAGESVTIAVSHLEKVKVTAWNAE